MWRIKEMLEDLYYSFKDSSSDDRFGKIKMIGKLLLTISIVIIFLGIPLGWYDNSNETNSKVINTNIAFIDNKDYEIMSSQELYKGEEYSVPKVDILLNNPEINEEEAKNILKHVFNQYRNMATNSNKEIISFEFNAYISRLEYELGIKPDGSFYRYAKNNLLDSINLTSTYFDSLENEFNVLENATIDFKAIEKRKDILLEDRDGIEILNIDLGPYYTDEELSVIYKIHEYVTLLGGKKYTNKAVGFYVYFDLGVELDTFKHETLVENYYDLYRDYTSQYKSRLPKFDRTTLAKHYRDKYPLLWSEFVIYRGF